MPFEIWVALGAAAMVILAWTSILSAFGTAETVDENGMLFRSLLRKRVFVRWDELRGPADRFESFMPRLILKRAPSKFFRVHRSYGILTNTTAPVIVAEIERRYGVRDVKKLQQLFR